MTYTQILQKRAKKTASTKAVKKFSLYDIILSPLITEKTHKQQESENKYYFRAHTDANKNDIREAVQHLYKVTPKKINIVNVCFKGRNNRKLVRGAYKKAIVTLGKKDKIELGS
ncbi:MAG: 50S ribosomal protein L23 [candidate division SR1 bacterium CG_4_9_14_3_um_filter_40_9]|nr:MAG: 50S ribosomal protein L23 [candidate division SR1 bacterium CG_4_9_14_3_um_filter_40_9]